MAGTRRPRQAQERAPCGAHGTHSKQLRARAARRPPCMPQHRSWGWEHSWAVQNSSSSGGGGSTTSKHSTPSSAPDGHGVAAVDHRRQQHQQVAQHAGVGGGGVLRVLAVCHRHQRGAWRGQGRQGVVGEKEAGGDGGDTSAVGPPAVLQPCMAARVLQQPACGVPPSCRLWPAPQQWGPARPAVQHSPAISSRMKPSFQSEKRSRSRPTAKRKVKREEVEERMVLEVTLV